MSVVLRRQAGLDAAYKNDIDWGSTTPINSVAELELDGDFGSAVLKRKKRAGFPPDSGDDVPRKQRALVLHGLRQRFALESDHPTPVIIKNDEILIQVKAIGLNPIDWKSVDYGFGIPELPYISGRDFAGVVVKLSSKTSHLQAGDLVLCPSTDYRDLRKAAYQEWAIATDSTVCRLPKHISTSQGAALGVAYVAAVLALGVCLGLPLPNIGTSKGPALLEILGNTPLGRIPRDMISECLAMEQSEVPKAGDWLVVWGGSSTSALFISQIARLAGLRVILVLDTAKHAARVLEASGFVCIDSHSATRAVENIRGITKGEVRFGIDTVGKDTTANLVQCLQPADGTPKARSHVVGLAALPKERLSGTVYHTVPVKLFHEVPAIGSSLMSWLEKALESKILDLPHVDEAPGGLGGINDALDLMRQGHVSGKRLVVPL